MKTERLTHKNSGIFFNCHSGYSFQYGTMLPSDLFAEAKRLGVHKLILTDVNNTAAYMEMLRLCDKHAPVDDGLTKHGQPGYELDIAVGIEFRTPEHQLLYIVIAKNNHGFEKLNRFLSFHNREHRPLPRRAPEIEDCFVIYPFGSQEHYDLRANEFIGVRKTHLTQFALLADKDEYMHKFVAWHPVTFLAPRECSNGKPDQRDFNTHRLLRAVANNTVLSKLAPEQQACNDEFMLSELDVEKAFANFPALIHNARMIVEHSTISLELGKDKNKKSVCGSKELDIEYLRSETMKGYERVFMSNPNYADAQSEVVSRIEKELRIIAQKDFTAYYLIAYDLVQFAKSQGFDYVGRGSGANSAVAFCLGITNVDPIELNLYFERFLNEERTTPPDFDIDFSWDNRDAIYDYLFKTYGEEYVCLLGTHVTYQWRSILRELGKVFGLPKDEIDSLVDNPAVLRDRDHITSLVYRYADYIVNKELPANFSIHAGGVLITERPIYAYSATEMPPKGYPVSHFEMHNAEDFGIFKFDILSQRGLGHIKETVKHVKGNQGVEVDIHRFHDFKRDDKVKELMRSSRTMGCFYVESPAMRMLLGKLRCEDYLTLVAASSIIRPGVSSSGMMRTYIERYHMSRNGKTYDVIHPLMDELMRETFGVMVYQEDVIKVAHEFAGITLTEADVLRRGMSGKYRSREEFQQVKNRFFEECEKRNYPSHVVERVWFEIESFSGYSFAKGHSASYAVESYQSLFLKAHYPLEFMVGVINNFGGFYKTEFYVHEARMNGATIEPPCINRSNYLTTIHGKTIFMGFVHVKSLEQKIVKAIEAERAAQGPYTDLENFLRRVPLGLEQLRILIRIGAIRFTGRSKQQLLWESMLFLSSVKARKGTTDLFDTAPKEYPLPALSRKNMEDAFDELELLGFPLCDPFCLLGTTNRGDTSAKELLGRDGRRINIVGYVVTTKESYTKNRQVMHFGTFLDQNGDVFDTVHFPDIARRFPFRGRGFYALQGKVMVEFGVPIVEIASMEKLPMIHKRAEEFLREPVEFRTSSQVVNTVA